MAQLCPTLTTFAFTVEDHLKRCPFPLGKQWHISWKISLANSHKTYKHDGYKSDALKIAQCKQNWINPFSTSEEENEWRWIKCLRIAEWKQKLCVNLTPMCLNFNLSWKMSENQPNQLLLLVNMTHNRWKLCWFHYSPLQFVICSVGLSYLICYMLL